MSILVTMIDSAFAPTDSGVGAGYSSASVVVSAQPGVVPPAPPTVPPAYNNPSPSAKPKKSGSFFKLFGLGLLLVVLIGGLITAYFLSQQEQEIRQQASQTDEYTQNSFTFQAIQNVDQTFLPKPDQPEEAPSFVKGKFLFERNPACNEQMSCNAQIKFEITEIDSGIAMQCTTNTANLVYYTFLTNTNDPNYLDNLTHNTTTTNSNCNRPLSQCDNDPQCTKSDIIKLYGPSGCEDQCRVFQGSIDFSITNTEYGCGCVQLDPNISELSLNCRLVDSTTFKTFTYTRDTTEEEGPWSSTSNTAQCSTPVIPSPAATITPTPTTPAGPTNTPTPTPTAPPFGGMCLSIAANPAAPAYNDSVTFTCGLVQGVSKYEFRYFEPGSLAPIKLDANANNVSKTIKVTKAGTYTAQCRICPTETAEKEYCSNPYWGWDPIVTTQE